MTIFDVLLLWSLLSVPASIFVGMFIRAGRGDYPEDDQ